MAELTLESLAKRIEALEQKLAAREPEPTGSAPPARDWRSVVGMFDDDPEFRTVIEEGRKWREADGGADRQEGAA